jgi:hypothetical protein
MRIVWPSSLLMANASALAVLGETVFPLIAFFSVLKSKFAPNDYYLRLHPDHDVARLQARVRVFVGGHRGQ